MAKRFNNAALPNGTFLGGDRYVIYKKISSGGYGSVYLAKDVEKNLYCAIKEFLPTSVDCRRSDKHLKLQFVSKEEKNRFENSLKNFYFEAEVVAKFNHPNIIKIYDVFRENNTAYIVMPLEKGLSLFLLANLHKKETKERLPDSEIKEIFLQICDGIEFLHKNNYLHLDIKPGNIWIRPNGSVVILDLGSSRNMDEYENQATPAFTAGYAPPEQYKDIKGGHIDERTDIYAIGGCLKFCLETMSPAVSVKKISKRDKNESFIDFLKRKIKDKFFDELKEDYIAARFGQVNYRLLKIVDKCMQLKKEDRYQSISEIKKDLSEINFTGSFCEYKKYIPNLIRNDIK